MLHRLNKNMVDGGSYITIGDMYKGNKIVLPDRWKGKGLSVSCLSHRSDTFALNTPTMKTQQCRYYRITRKTTQPPAKFSKLDS